eukprot:15454542-Alexandrium_andersonii.AAC.1
MKGGGRAAGPRGGCLGGGGCAGWSPAPVSPRCVRPVSLLRLRWVVEEAAVEAARRGARGPESGSRGGRPRSGSQDCPLRA